MARSLHEQLLKAGLVDKNKVKQAKKSQHKKQKAKNKAVPTEEVDSKQMAAKVAQEKAERDRALNQQKQSQANKKAIQAQIIELVRVNRLACENGDTPFRFVDNGVVKKIYMTETLADDVARARIAIVRYGQEFALVPAVVARKIQERDTTQVVHLAEQKTNAEPEADDPYADYQIPDDLMW